MSTVSRETSGRLISQHEKQCGLIGVRLPSWDFLVIPIRPTDCQVGEAWLMEHSLALPRITNISLEPLADIRL
jgi:hypothetical protein